MAEWRITFEGTGQAIGDTLNHTLYVAHADDVLSTFTATQNASSLIRLSGSNPAQGTRSLEVSTSASASCYGQMSESAWVSTTRWYSTYIYLPTASGAPPAAGWSFFQVREAATLNRCQLSTGRQVQVLNGSTVVGTMTAVLAFDTLYRVSYRTVYSATVGILEAKLYLGHSTTPIETLTVSALNTGTVLATNTRWGIPVAIGPCGPWFMDDVRASDVAEPPPSSGLDLTFETGIAGWQANAPLGGWDIATLAQSGAQFRSGSKSMQITCPTSVNDSAGALALIDGLTIGQRYFVQVWGFSTAPVGVADWQAHVYFVAEGSVIPLKNQWALGTVVFTATATSHHIGAQMHGFTAGDVLFIDDVSIVPVVAQGLPGKAKRWNGSAWVTNGNIKRWNGSAFVSVKAKPYD